MNKSFIIFVMLITVPIAYSLEPGPPVNCNNLNDLGKICLDNPVVGEDFACLSNGEISVCCEEDDIFEVCAGLGAGTGGDGDTSCEEDPNQERCDEAPPPDNNPPPDISESQTAQFAWDENGVAHICGKFWNLPTFNPVLPSGITIIENEVCDNIQVKESIQTAAVAETYTCYYNAPENSNELGTWEWKKLSEPTLMESEVINGLSNTYDTSVTTVKNAITAVNADGVECTESGPAGVVLSYTYPQDGIVDAGQCAASKCLLEAADGDNPDQCVSENYVEDNEPYQCTLNSEGDAYWKSKLVLLAQDMYENSPTADSYIINCGPKNLGINTGGDEAHGYCELISYKGNGEVENIMLGAFLKGDSGADAFVTEIDQIRSESDKYLTFSEAKTDTDRFAYNQENNYVYYSHSKKFNTGKTGFLGFLRNLFGSEQTVELKTRTAEQLFVKIKSSNSYEASVEYPVVPASDCEGREKKAIITQDQEPTCYSDSKWRGTIQDRGITE